MSVTAAAARVEGVLEPLSEREFEVLRPLAIGASDRVIVDRLLEDIEVHRVDVGH
jgi:hypothetical protein